MQVAGANVLRKSGSFTRLAPTRAVVAFRAGAFDLMTKVLHSPTQVLNVRPLGITNASCSGVGVVLTAVVGATVSKRSLDLLARFCIAGVAGGVVVMQVFSIATGHRP